MGGAVSRGRYHPARDRGDEVITTDTITRADVSLLEKHLGGRCAMERVDRRRPAGCFGYFASCTAGYIVRTREERLVTKAHQIRGARRAEVLALAQNILDS